METPGCEIFGGVETTRFPDYCAIGNADYYNCPGTLITPSVERGDALNSDIRRAKDNEARQLLSAQPYHRYTLWIDGILRDSQVLRRPVDGAFDRLSVGAGLDASDQADAMLDELRLSSLPRLGNSQQVRLIVSQQTDNSIAVTDWLGNPVSRLGGPGPALGQFSSPQGLDIRGNRSW